METIKPSHMRSLINCFFCIAIALLALPACNPKIYFFTADAVSIGQNDPVRVKWKVKGEAILLISDANYPGSGTARLHDLTLVITRDGKAIPYTLHTDDTLRLPLPGEDSLVVLKQPDNFSEDILRTMVLVARLHDKEVPKTVQLEVRLDSADSQIAFRPKESGDSLLAADTNNVVRWDDRFTILTVAADSNRTLVVTHSNITRVLHPGDPPDEGFKGTPVRGYWSFRTIMTPEEKNHTQRLPRFVGINITIKHR
jgi:hypothetical protein